MVHLNSISTFLVSITLAVVSKTLGLEVTIASTEEDIRLNNPKEQKNEGLVEVKVHGRWGPLCGRDIDYNIARVICKQLGYSDYKNYYNDAQDEFHTYTVYNETFYIGLACYDDDVTSISYCGYDHLIGTKDQCGSIHGYAGVECYNEESDSFEFFSIFRYVGWFIMIGVCALIYWGVRGRFYRNRQQRMQQAAINGIAVSTTNNGQGVVIPAPRGAAYPPPAPGSYPTQSQANYQYPQPAADAPPQYDAIAPPQSAPQYPQGYPPQNGGALYPPQSAGAPQDNSAPYPSQGAPYPPSQGLYNPAFPPADYAPNMNDTAPSMPPPAYETVADSGGGDQSKA